MPLPHKKNFLRDVLPKSSTDNSFMVKKIKEENDVIYHKVDEPIIDYTLNNNSGRGRWRIWSLVIVVVLALTAVVFYVFSSAKVTITPRIDNATFGIDFKASKLGTSSDSSKLYYNVSTIEKIGTKSLDADGEKVVDRKASGTIIIYNNFSSSSQKLIKNTRFETPDGLIYRIDQSIVIPGRSTVNGQVTPGSVEAKVYADESGVKYNIGITTFTIPGFKSDSTRYAGFYASSKTPMLDGFSGKANYVLDDKQKLARAEIRSELEKQILTEAKTNITKDYFIPNGAYTIEFETQPSVDVEGGKVALKEKASVSVYAFKTFDWDQFLASNASFASSIGSSTVQIINRDSLSFAWLSRPSTDSSEISFRVNGEVNFSWLIDAKKISASLAGKNRKDLQEVLKQWDGIVTAKASLSPFWRSNFPNDPNKIKVNVEIPKGS